MSYPHPQATSPPIVAPFVHWPYTTYPPPTQPTREPEPSPAPQLPPQPQKPQYPPTEVNTSGKYSEKRTPELADVSLRIKAEGYDKAGVLREFKIAANEIIQSVTALAPPKVAVAAGSLVDAEWPIKNPDKPVVTWSTGQLSTRSWEETESEKTTTTAKPGGIRFITTDPTTTVETTEYKIVRKYATSQTLSITFHDFGVLELSVTRATVGGAGRLAGREDTALTPPPRRTRTSSLTPSHGASLPRRARNSRRL